MQGTPWTNFAPPLSPVTPICLMPRGFRFNSELLVNAFDDNQILEDYDDLELITANIEHSYVGDLTMSVICPNGTEVILMENGPSGDTTPNDCNPLDGLGNTNDLNSNDLGIFDVEGYDYSWSMEGEYILDGADNPNVDGFEPIPAGIYLPCGDLCDFVGCPLNGIWTFSIIDQWGGQRHALRVEHGFQP